MDIILLIFAIILVIVGILGSFLPVLPGPPLNYIALILIHFTRFAEFETSTLVIYGAVVLIVQVFDYIVPIWGTKKFGGTKYGAWGSTIGLVVSIFVLPVLGIVIGPFGIISLLAGPFFGALIGEKMGGQSSEKAFRSAIGSFIGFLAGTFIKLATAIVLTVVFCKEVFSSF